MLSLRPKADDTPGPCPPRLLITRRGSHVLLLVWEELWSLVRIIPAEFGLAAGGPGPLQPLASPAEGQVSHVLHGFLLHSRVREARSLGRKWGGEIDNKKAHGLEIQTPRV